MTVSTSSYIEVSYSIESGPAVRNPLRRSHALSLSRAFATMADKVLPDKMLPGDLGMRDGKMVAGDLGIAIGGENV